MFGIFLIWEDFWCLDNKESCKIEIWKIILLLIEIEIWMRWKISFLLFKGKIEMIVDDENVVRDDMILKYNFGGLSKLDDLVLCGISLVVKLK